MGRAYESDLVYEGHRKKSCFDRKIRMAHRKKLA
jgi:hypothetical protein